MLRKEIAKRPEGENKVFRLRGHEILRIEALSDAVFALAVTLLIVSLEVPKSFEELMRTMRGFFAFGISFLLLMLIWYEQNIFFRRYGMHDIITVSLNCTLIFLVLFYVYPLKFLFTLMFNDQIYDGYSPLIITVGETSKLMLIYGVGYTLIYVLFFFMYMHALRKKEQLQLIKSEIFDTRTSMFAKVILVMIGLLSIAVSQMLPNQSAGLAGMIYILIGPSFSVFYRYRNRKKRKLPVE